MLNDGCDVWPNGTILQPVSSNDIEMLRATNQALPATKPGSFVTVSTMITIPRQPGHYRTEFKLRSPNGQLFGDDLWVDIISVPENSSSNNNSMVYPTISTASSASSSNNQRPSSVDITSVIRHDELVDPSDENEDDDDDPFMDPSITSYTPSRRLSSSSLETSSEEEEEVVHGNNDDESRQASRASSEEFVVIDNNTTNIDQTTQNPHEKTPPKATTPTASFYRQPTTQMHTSPAAPTRNVATTANPVPGLFDQQMRQIHEMVSRHSNKESMSVLTF